MSASREKQRRRGSDEFRKQTFGSNGGRRPLKSLFIAVCITLAVAIIVASAMISGGYLHRGTTALTVGNHKVSPVMFNYFYQQVYGQLSQSASADSSAMQYLAGIVSEQVLSTIANTYAIYDVAVDAGYTIDEDGEARIQQELDTLGTHASTYGYPNGNVLLIGQFGKGSTISSYREYLALMNIVERYTQDKLAEFKATYTPDTISAYYAEHADELDTVSYRMEILDDEATAQALAKAGKGDEDAFIRGIVEAELAATEAEALPAETEAPADTAEDNQAAYDAARDSTLYDEATIANLPEETAEWLSDPSRAEGDTTVIQAADETVGYYALYFIARNDNTFSLPTVRHILIAPEVADDEQSLKAAEAKANDLLNEFLAGEETEDAFAALASQNTADTGSADNGGLYENITPDSMQAEFETWCYDASRAVGDTGIVQTTYGYHIMYFCGFGDIYRDYQVKQALQNEDYNQWIEVLAADYTPEKHSFGMRYVNAS